MASITTKEMWERVKRYFRDGHVPGSAPLGFNMHICKMDELSTSSKATSTGINGSAYGVEIKESLMPLFSVLGDTASPNCTCFDVTNIIKHIEEYLTTAPDNHPNDFTITSWKNDIDVEDANLYAMRDAVCWWTHWTGALRPEDHWKQMYVVFSTIPDDVQIPPSSIVDGSYRCLGHTWADCKQGLIEEGVPPTWVELAEMCLWREALIQYFEKIDPKVYCLLKANTTLMTQHRTFTANTLGCAVMVLASEGKDSREAGRFALEAAGIADCLSMDIAKESLGILQGEKTETVAGDRAQLKRELRWIYIRCMEYLKAQPNAHILRRFGSGGLHFVPMMDRYLERVRSNIRFPITDAQARKLEPFINRAYVREGLNPNGLLQQAEKERVKGNQ